MGLPDFQLTDTSGTAACSQSAPCLPPPARGRFHPRPLRRISSRCGHLLSSASARCAAMPEHLPDATASDRSATRKAVLHEGRGLRLPKIRKNRPGTAAGINHEQLDGLQSGPGEVRVTVIDYRADNVLVRTIDDIDAFVAGHRPEWSAVCWINVDGLTDMKCVSALAAKYELHPLAVEDLLHVPQRPKVDAFGEGRRRPARHASRASVRRREDAPAEGRAPLERADQLLRRSPHAADVPGDAGRRVGSDSTAASEARARSSAAGTPAFSSTRSSTPSSIMASRFSSSTATGSKRSRSRC